LHARGCRPPGPETGDRGHLLVEVQPRYLELSVNIRGMCAVALMQQFEFIVCQPNSPHPRSPACLVEVSEKMDDSAGRQFTAVDCRGVRSQHVHDDDVEAMSEEPLCQPARVLRAEGRLSSSFRAPPRCVSTSHYELPYVVNVDEGCPRPALGEPAPRRGLPDGWPSGEQ
jgi:hypothetical protein